MWNFRFVSKFILCLLLCFTLTLGLVTKRHNEGRMYFLNSDRIHFPEDSDEVIPKRPSDTGYIYPGMLGNKMVQTEQHDEKFDNNGRTLPVELARKLSQIDDIRELVNDYFDEPLQILKDINKSTNNDIHITLQSRFGDDESSERVKKVSYPSFATCKALPEVVLLEPENPLTDSMYVPSCTRVNRCSGCCVLDRLKCQPTEVEARTFYVLESKYFANVSKFKFVANREVQVEEHKKCHCACQTKEEECNEKQEYVQSYCRCVCRNVDERLLCTSRIHRWDDSSCRCACRQEMSCTGTRYFDNDRCRCIRKNRTNAEIVNLS